MTLFLFDCDGNYTNLINNVLDILVDVNNKKLYYTVFSFSDESIEKNIIDLVNFRVTF